MGAKKVRGLYGVRCGGGTGYGVGGGTGCGVGAVRGTVWGRYEVRCGGGTGYGVAAVRGTVWGRYGVLCGGSTGPARSLYRLLWAVLGERKTGVGILTK